MLFAFRGDNLAPQALEAITLASLYILITWQSSASVVVVVVLVVVVVAAGVVVVVVVVAAAGAIAVTGAGAGVEG